MNLRAQLLASLACEQIVAEYDEERTPGDPKCGDCNLGTGPHIKYCAYHAAKAALAEVEATKEAVARHSEQMIAHFNKFLFGATGAGR